MCNHLSLFQKLDSQQGVAAFTSRSLLRVSAALTVVTEGVALSVTIFMSCCTPSLTIIRQLSLCVFISPPLLCTDNLQRLRSSSPPKDLEEHNSGS